MSQSAARPVLVVREPGTDAPLEYYHAAPGLLLAGLWAALKAHPGARTQEQVQIIYAWLLQLRTENLLQRLRPETLHTLALHSMESGYHPTFDIRTSHLATALHL